MAWTGTERRGEATLGIDWQRGQGRARPGAARIGKATQARHGQVRPGGARQRRRGGARRGPATIGMGRQRRPGEAPHGRARQGTAGAYRMFLAGTRRKTARRLRGQTDATSTARWRRCDRLRQELVAALHRRARRACLSPFSAHHFIVPQAPAPRRFCATRPSRSNATAVSAAAQTRTAIHARRSGPTTNRPPTQPTGGTMLSNNSFWV